MEKSGLSAPWWVAALGLGGASNDTGMAIAAAIRLTVGVREVCFMGAPIALRVQWHIDG